MNYTAPPANVRSLEQRLRNLEGDDTAAHRRRVTMALVVVGQMLGDAAVRGGGAMALRFGGASRFTRDLDVARAGSPARFRNEFEEALALGWCGFTGRLVERTPPRPAAVTRAYVMQPFEVKLDYLGRSWCTVAFELGHNEIGDAEEPELRLADDLADLFTGVGLDRPKPVRVMRADHQVAQKLHAVSAVGSERARDLIDLQLLERMEHLEPLRLAMTCTRLFRYRRLQAWPPRIVVGAGWDSLYETASRDLDVLSNVADAVAWANELVDRIAAADPGEAIVDRQSGAGVNDKRGQVS